MLQVYRKRVVIGRLQPQQLFPVVDSLQDTVNKCRTVLLGAAWCAI